MDEDSAVTLLHEAIKLGIPTPTIDVIKAANPPHNILFDIGTDRNPSMVHLKHIKENGQLLIEIGKRFVAGIPNKVICRLALIKFDDEHRQTLSKAQNPYKELEGALRCRPPRGGPEPAENHNFYMKNDNPDRPPGGRCARA